MPCVQQLWKFEKCWAVAEKRPENQIGRPAPIPNWFKITDVYVYGHITGSIHPFGTILSAYSCSTMSGLHVDMSYFLQIASEPNLWWVKAEDPKIRLHHDEQLMKPTKPHFCHCTPNIQPYKACNASMKSPWHMLSAGMVNKSKLLSFGKSVFC